MSTTQRPEPRVLPPLEDGQQLDQPTFHERYEAMPPGTWAELIGGMVHMPSPLHLDHGDVDASVGYWLSYYRRFTPGLRVASNVSTILGQDSEVQPDHQLLIPAELGGQTRVVGGYVSGAPELVAEISKSSRRLDLGKKKADYQRAGVLEYVVVALDPDGVFWFARREGQFVQLEAGADGWYRSEVFPGLWLDPGAIYTGDLNRVTAALEQGLATPEHAAFVARLAAARQPRP